MRALLALVRALLARLRRRLRAALGPGTTAHDQAPARTPDDGPALAMPQLPAIAGPRDDRVPHPNRMLGTPGGTVVPVGAGPWRELGVTPARAAALADLRTLDLRTVGLADVADPTAVETVAPGVAPTRAPAPAPAAGTMSPVLGVIGPDLKFVRPILDVLERRGTVQVTVDAWPRFRGPVSDRTAQVLAAADVVLAEWCGPNAVEASRQLRPDQRLVVRLHRFELEDGAWRDVDTSRVDAVIAVSEPYRRQIVAVTGWPAELVVVVPNAVDVAGLDLPKLASARWTLGMLGVDRSRKRIDRALDVLERLRATDERWQLRVKGTPPWESPWVQQRPDEVAWFDTQLARLAREPLRSGVVFDPGGPDVADWLRGVGHVLSPSDDESFHLAPAEGMASGAVPVLWPWPGSDEIYDPRWVVADVEEAVARLVTLGAHDATWAREVADARSFLRERYALESVATCFANVLLP